MRNARLASAVLAVVGSVGADGGRGQAARAAPRTAAAPQPPPASLLHKITVDARGPLALVEVVRELGGTRGESGGLEALLDLAIPEPGLLVEVEVRDGERWRRLDDAKPVETARAADLYRSESAARGATVAYEPYDDSAAYRIRVARSGGPKGTIGIRYRFAAPAAFSGGRYRLRFPPAPESLPAPAEVSVTTRDAIDVEVAGSRSALAGGAGTVSGRASTRAGWEISWAPRDPAPAPEAPSIEARVAAAALGPNATALAYAVRSRPARAAGSPTSVLFVVDRSRSVGLPGLSAERDLARRLLEDLPPQVRFDALFFDRATQRLFPMSRPATREAIDTLEAEMVPSRLQNGTDLAAALRDAGALLRREQSSFGPRVLLAVITDGALPDGQDGAALDRALGKLGGFALELAVFAVRPPDDDRVSPSALRALRAFAGDRGGITREIAAADLDEAAHEALVALDQGGDLAGIRLVADGHAHPLADALPPGASVAGVLALPGRPPRTLELEATAAGQRTRAPPRREVVPGLWLRPFMAVSPSASAGMAASPSAGRAAAPPSAGTEAPPSAGAGPQARLLVASTLAALVEPVPRTLTASEPPVRGSMDRMVMRNVLSLAYLPRARACYLDRTGATPALRDLAGKVRLAIDVARGEVEGARIESSTLAHADIERCLRDGAFAIEVPRAVRSDAPVTAILNLVFRPRTPEKKTTPELGPVTDAIDLIVEEAQREESAAGASAPPGPPGAPLPAPAPPRSFPTR